MPIITVILRGGLVQEVEDIPIGFTVRIVDFDTEGAHEDSIETQASGERAVVQEFSASLPPLPHTTRNTKLLHEIIAILQPQSPAVALETLEQYYRDELLLNAGDTEFVATAAEELRLAITTAEAAQVLDYIEAKGLAGITIDQVEEAINTLFEDRFIEP